MIGELLHGVSWLKKLKKIKAPAAILHLDPFPPLRQLLYNHILLHSLDILCTCNKSAVYITKLLNGLVVKSNCASLPC